MRVRYPYRFHLVCVCGSFPSTLTALLGRSRGKLCNVAFRSSRHVTFSFLCLSYSRPRRRNSHALRPQHFFPNPCQYRGEQKTHTGAHFWFVSCCLFPHSDRLLTPQRRAGGTRTLLGVEKMVECDYPVPCGCISKARRVDRDASRLMNKVLIRSTLLTVK